MSFFVTADGGLTTAGYVGCVVLMVALVVIASVLSAQKSKGTGMDARKLAFCAMGMAFSLVMNKTLFALNLSAAYKAVSVFPVRHSIDR